ncbi:protein of unknown function [Paraburkholderia dioscoreae]|uniref:Uncharacterized protein n=1 Tax=Paraburkholderia dioscoreae TaxID=2604047 RepID=A0A5Q4ZK87_9BURK|nr:protein of unknown function [Paraburkholderia dioscoreae]
MIYIDFYALHAGYETAWAYKDVRRATATNCHMAVVAEMAVGAYSACSPTHMTGPRHDPARVRIPSNRRA